MTEEERLEQEQREEEARIAAERKARRAKRAAREARRKKKRKKKQREKMLKIAIPVGGVLLLLILIFVIRGIVGGGKKKDSDSSGGSTEAVSSGAVANADGTVTLGDGTVVTGTLNANGSVTLEDGTVVSGSGSADGAAAGAENASGGSVATMDYSNLSTDEATILSEADRLAAMYDYDGAIARVQAFAGYESNQNMLDAIDRYTQTKSMMTADSKRSWSEILLRRIMTAGCARPRSSMSLHSRCMITA